MDKEAKQRIKKSYLLLVNAKRQKVEEGWSKKEPNP